MSRKYDLKLMAITSEFKIITVVKIKHPTVYLVHRKYILSLVADLGAGIAQSV
jgi:hypothetical protein